MVSRITPEAVSLDYNMINEIHRRCMTMTYSKRSYSENRAAGATAALYEQIGGADTINRLDSYPGYLIQVGAAPSAYCSLSSQRWSEGIQGKDIYFTQWE